MREKPQYGEKQEATQNRRDEAEKRERDIEKSDTFKRIVEEQRATREQQDRHEQAKRDRDNRTMWGVWATAVAALITVIVAHIDTRGVIDEAQRSANQQHTDTLAALARSDAAIAEARRLADAARDQANTATDTEKRQLRAYVHFVGKSTPHLDGIPVEMRGSQKNFGLTPAYHVYGAGNLGVAPAAWATTPMPQPDKIKGVGSPTRTYLAPTEEQDFPILFPSSGRQTLTPEEQSDIRAGKLRLFAFGVIYYDDVFGKSHTTEFRMDYGGEEAIRLGKMRWTEAGNEAN